jgi:hypothetical protein
MLLFKVGVICSLKGELLAADQDCTPLDNTLEQKLFSLWNPIDRNLVYGRLADDAVGLKGGAVVR